MLRSAAELNVLYAVIRHRSDGISICQAAEMRLYLSSFRLGQHHEHLLQLGGHGRRTALIPNALDNISAEDRSQGLRRDLDELEAAGLAVEMLDLRHTGAVDRLAGFDVVWVRGGNVFVLRRALADTARTPC